MANPTIQPTGDGSATTLITDAPAERIGPPAARVALETVPDVNGAFGQPLGYGPRGITVTGIYKGTAQNTAALAVSNFKTTARAIQTKIGRVGTYVGQDSTSYTNAILRSWQYGRVRITRPSNSTFQAIAAVSAEVIDLAPA